MTAVIRTGAVALARFCGSDRRADWRAKRLAEKKESGRVARASVVTPEPNP